MAALACGLTTGAAVAADGSAAPRYTVKVVRDVAYRELYEGEEASKGKNKLDLFLPQELKSFPVVLFVHGGAWVHGDKSFFGFYSSFCRALARQGIGVVATNYRLSPTVRHPEHIRDVARAFAWTHKNIAKYGGQADRIFLCGHSAGGHLVSLLATDDTFLKAERLTLQAIKGVIPLSGVYDLPEGMAALEVIFGPDAKVRKDASPVAHARADAPPFLILYAENDLNLCSKPFAEAFCKALQAKTVQAEALEVPERHHMSIIGKASADNDPVARAILGFIARHGGQAAATGGR
jgi:acetyl esterase/lipase